jgi:hypothetical protein
MTAVQAPGGPTARTGDPRSRVPVRTIAATIGMVLLTAAVLLLGWEVRRVLTWIVVAALLAIILGPLVDLTERRLHLRRALATLLLEPRGPPRSNSWPVARAAWAMLRVGLPRTLSETVPRRS